MWNLLSEGSNCYLTGYACTRKHYHCGRQTSESPGGSLCQLFSGNITPPRVRHGIPPHVILSLMGTQRPIPLDAVVALWRHHIACGPVGLSSTPCGPRRQQRRIGLQTTIPMEADYGLVEVSYCLWTRRP